MRASRFAVLAAVLIASSVYLSASASATVGVLYVNRAVGAHCSDTGTGTWEQPYCTISAAVAAVSAGQTIQVGGGDYNEHVDFDKSGTPDAPITLQGAQLYGVSAGLTVDGQHDVRLKDVLVQGVVGVPGIVISNASNITLDSVGVRLDTSAAAPGIALYHVTDSLLNSVNAIGAASPRILLDAATSHVRLQSASMYAANYLPAAGTVDIEVAGSDNAVLDTDILGGATTGIHLESSATGTVVANNRVAGMFGDGIVDDGANDVAITSNTAWRNCGSGIRITGAATGVSVQNNVAITNGQTVKTCVPDAASAVDIGVDADAVTGTTVDYNRTYQATGSPYAWGAQTATLAQFHVLSGQGLHDIFSDQQTPDIDSANSAAPGEQATDMVGRTPEDDPDVPNTGPGPVADIDRGALETVQGPTAQLRLSGSGLNSTVTADASGSTPGWVPAATYTFGFGDGSSVVQSTPVVSHTYAHPGLYTVDVTVTDANRVKSATVQSTFVSGDGFTPTPPTRVLDTRNAIGVPTRNAVSSGGTLILTVVKPGGPLVGSDAVVLNVTVTGGTGSGYLTVYPDGQVRPPTSNLNWAPGQTVPNLVTVPLVDGKVAFYNGSGATVHIVADLFGFYAPDTGAGYAPLAPVRVLDTATP